MNPNTNDIDFAAWMADTVNDQPFDWCLDLIHAMSAAGHHIIFLSRRGDTPKGRELTDQWLKKWLSPDVEYSVILSTPLDDGRPDDVVKLELYYNLIAPYYDVKMAIDDKFSNISMFRSLGIPALHCADY